MFHQIITLQTMKEIRPYDAKGEDVPYEYDYTYDRHGNWISKRCIGRKFFKKVFKSLSITNKPKKYLADNQLINNKMVLKILSAITLRWTQIN